MSATGVTALLFLALLGRAQAQAGGGTCFDTLARRIDGDSQLQYFQRALSETALDAALDGPGPYLVFAPTDAAFENLQGSVLNLELSKLIQYHVSPTSGYEQFFRLAPGSYADIKSLCSDCDDVRVELLSNGQVLVNGEARALQSVETCNGVLITVDTILSPEVSGGGAAPPPSSSSPPPFSEPPAQLECSLEDPSCCDLPPPEFDCAQQRVWGKCDEPWMLLGNGNGGFCRYTCGRCGRQPSFDNAPEYEYEYERDPSPSPSPERNFDGRRPPRSPVDPRLSCQCTETGVSGGVDTGQPGCFQINVAERYASQVGASAGRRVGEAVAGYWGGNARDTASYFSSLWGNIASSWAGRTFGDSTTNICYVMDPSGCAVAEPSQIHSGAGWRSCD